MGKKRKGNWLPKSCKCGCHMLVATVGQYTYSAFIHIGGNRDGHCDVYEGGCSRRGSRYFDTYTSFGMASYRTWLKLQKRVKVDKRELAAVGL